VHLASVCLSGLALAACSSSSTHDGGDARSQQPLEYVAPCTPDICDDLPVPEIGCADGTEPTIVCAPGSDGECHATPTCAGGDTSGCGGAGGGDGTVSYAPCDPSECGPIPAIGCPPGDTMTESCGSENGGACVWTIGCQPPPSTIPCAQPDGCGPMPELAP